jgi:hypothetical protein
MLSMPLLKSPTQNRHSTYILLFGAYMRSKEASRRHFTAVILPSEWLAEAQDLAHFTITVNVLQHAL